MPRIRRTSIPQGLFRHLLDRIQERKIGEDALLQLARWLDEEPEVPESGWYKRFRGMTVCGEGDLIKTFLLPGQHPKGKQVR